MSKSETLPTLTTEMAREILNKTLEELQTPSNVQKLDEARDNIQIDIIKEFGYPEGREGIIKFSQLLRGIEREDAEIARLHSLVKSYYLPPVAVRTTNESPSAEERATSS